MKCELITEMPWLNLNGICPICGAHNQETTDYKIELWKIPLTFKTHFKFNTEKDAKKKYINALMYADKIPVLCVNPKCNHVYMYDKKSEVTLKDTPTEDIKTLLQINRWKIYPKITESVISEDKQYPTYPYALWEINPMSGMEIVYILNNRNSIINPRNNKYVVAYIKMLIDGIWHKNYGGLPFRYANIMKNTKDVRPSKVKQYRTKDEFERDWMLEQL
jgi:hypothetical protein